MSMTVIGLSADPLSHAWSTCVLLTRTTTTHLRH